jgi:two-component system, sensor histidine kinase RegB
MSWRDAKPTRGRFLHASFDSMIANPIASRFRELLAGQSDQAIWLVQLRWFAVIGQLTTIAAVYLFFPVRLAIGGMLALVGLTAITNIVYWFWLRRRPRLQSDEGASNPSIIEPILMILDLATLSAMLYLSGGVENPFLVFYFVNLAVAAMALAPRWAWTLTGLAVIAHAALQAWHRDVGVLEGSPESGSSWTDPIRVQGQFVAFTACATVLTYFISQVAQQSKRGQRVIREIQQQQARSQRLEALTTLAAGAAHELSSPLSTIAVVAREMDRHLASGAAIGSLRDDLKLIDGELEHCRQILARMRSTAGDRSAERWDRLTVGDLLDHVVEGVRHPDRVDVPVTNDVEQLPLHLPVEAVAQAIRNLVQNALDASPADAEVTLSARADAGKVVLEVRDQGHGMPAEVLQRVGEPFYTTKQPGHGTGLGLFLTRNVIQRLGGDLEIDSVPAQGTTVRVRLPCSPIPTPQR